MNMKNKFLAALGVLALLFGGSVLTSTSATAAPNDCVTVQAGSAYYQVWMTGDNGNARWYNGGQSTCGVAWVWVNQGYCIKFKMYDPYYRESTYCNGMWVDVPNGRTTAQHYKPLVYNA